jgi:hypothetical protein
VNPEDYDDWLMTQAGERAERRRRLMVWALLVAMGAMLFVPVIQAFT